MPFCKIKNSVFVKDTVGSNVPLFNFLNVPVCDPLLRNLLETY